nr:ribonuclease H-like domain-containing protein [Tanacetum cinerariifolium]
ADEGFFVGYSLNSKAFEVFNSRTRIVEENLHIRMMDSNLQVMMDRSLTVDAVGTNGVNVVGENVSSELPFDPDMPTLEDVGTFNFSNEDEDDDEEADMNNLDTTIQKFGFTEVKNASTPMETQKPLLKDKDGKVVDVHMYRYQVNIKVSHLHVVKRIFRGDRLVMAATTASSLKAEQDSGNIDKTQSKETPNEASSPKTTLGGGPTCQEAIGIQLLKLGLRMCLNFPMIHCSQKVLALEKTKTTQALKITSLERRVKKLEKKQRSRTHKLKRLYKVGLTARMDSSEDKQNLGEDASKQRRIEAINADVDITLVNDQDDADMFDVNDLHGEEVFVEKEVADKEVSVVGEVNTASIATTISAAATITIEEVTLAKALVQLKTSKPKVKEVFIQEPSESITTTIIISLKKSQDKGKAIMVEEPVKPKKKDQIRLDKKAALELQAELQVEFEEEQRLARKKAQK